MDHTVEKLEKSKVKFSFVADKAAYDAAVVTVYQKTKHKYNVPGFRKGHAPKKVIEGMYGAGVFFSDAVNELIDGSIAEIDRSGEYKLVAFDSVEDVDVTEDGGVKYAIIMVVSPEVTLGEYKGLPVERKAVRVTAKQVDEYVAQQQQKQTRTIDLDAPAENGNIVNLDFVGKVDGVEFSGGKGSNYDLTLGSGSFIPGFEEQLVGASAGEDRSVNVTFPEDYPQKDLAGKPAVFECHINAVKKSELPELNDEFAKEISEFDTLAEYKEDVKKRLVSDAEKNADREYEDAIVKAICDGSQVEIPDVMIEQESEDMVGDFEHRLYYQGITLEQYYNLTGTTKEKLMDSFKETATRNVKVRLVLEAIIEKEDVKVEEADIDAKIAEYAEEQSMTPDEFRKSLAGEQLNYFVNAVMSEKLMNLLKSFNPSVKKTSGKKTEKKEEVASDEASEPVEEKPKKKAPAKKTTKKADETQSDKE